MALSSTKIRPVVARLLETHNVVSPAVPVERIAKREGVILKYQPFEGEMAGMLVNTGDQVVIGVNSHHHVNRQRFTIAHELGHYKLHSKTMTGVHIDRAFKVHRRDQVSTLAIDDNEIEANRFAAELLMPKSMIMHDIEQMFDIEDAHELRVLAKKYEVSPLAMANRVSNLLHLHKVWG